jgi:hypothetical protein
MESVLSAFFFGLAIGVFGGRLFLKDSVENFEQKKKWALWVGFIFLAICILLSAPEIIRGFNDGWNAATNK